MLTREQFQELRNKGLSVSQIQAFESGKTPSDLASAAKLKNETTGNQFAQEKPTSFLGKARDFVAGITGGGKLAEGAGQAIAAPGIQKSLSAEQQQTFDLQKKVLGALRKAKEEGRDTSKLEKALKSSQDLATTLDDAQSDFTDSLVSNKEVIGSALRLGGTLAGGAIAGKASKVFALGKAATFASGALRGAGAGALGGAIEGGIQGAGLGLEANKSAGGVAASAAIGAGLGAAVGAPVGAITGGVGGALRGRNDPNKVLSYVTPETKELTPTQYKKALERGLITPKTATQPAQFSLPKTQQQTALKYADIIEKDPVKTALNLSDKIGELDDDVGVFLRRNNGIFSKGELRNAISSSFEDISDITIDEGRLATSKQKLVDNFVKSLETNDMESLWMARKNYDQAIDSAFKGSPTLQKEVKIALRDAVQQFIKDRTPDQVYQGYMDDMTGLFRLRDSVAIKASKERSLDAIRLWVKNHPKTAKTVGWGTLLLAGNQILNFLNPFGDGKGGSSSG